MQTVNFIHGVDSVQFIFYIFLIFNTIFKVVAVQHLFTSSPFLLMLAKYRWINNKMFCEFFFVYQFNFSARQSFFYGLYAIQTSQASGKNIKNETNTQKKSSIGQSAAVLPEKMVIFYAVLFLFECFALLIFGVFFLCSSAWRGRQSGRERVVYVIVWSGFCTLHTNK